MGLSPYAYRSEIEGTFALIDGPAAVKNFGQEFTMKAEFRTLSQSQGKTLPILGFRPFPENRPNSPVCPKFAAAIALPLPSHLQWRLRHQVCDSSLPCRVLIL
jgi:hypothetical protein